MKHNVGIIWEDSGPTVLMRIVGQGGTNITQSDINTITYQVNNIDSADSTTATASSTGLTVSSVVYNTLQRDALWKNEDGEYIDDEGYNFKHALPASAFPVPSKLYHVKYRFTPASGEAWNDVVPIKVLSVVD